MKTTFRAPIRRRILLGSPQFSELAESGQAIGQPTRQPLASPGCQVSQGALAGNQRFLRAQ
ncbi:hypothetical protein E4631_13795 [Hymenobacter sp. UV11]|uniref:hypothetical protein n=1 Tax=Hymenobacter sp. UV11 TaxID=1849735 RepID=UPI001061DBFB|nr:hypothetical protein [Hymenobacter sp. UV11]TFZ66154.1 hypothetical protein E4631_13795 [Hymenobacter sp. UV11]